MRKLYLICTSAIILILIVHMVYMVTALFGGVTFNLNLAIIMGYTLMSLAVLHGIYGLIKCIKVIVGKVRLKSSKSMNITTPVTSAAVITLIQRITAVIAAALIVPHTLIRVTQAESVPLILDILFVVALIVHLLIGIPKLLVSMGLLRKGFERKFSAFFGGKGNV